MKYTPSSVKDVLATYQISLKKKFGQNFIIDENIINNIVNIANIDNETLVLEVGPGLGVLTQKLALTAKNVLSYEIDRTLAPVLNSLQQEYQNIEIIFEDFLVADIITDIKKYEYKSLVVVANLPYYITTAILVKLIETKINIDRLIVMVQKEVGNRFKAAPGTKDYNSLSIFINYYYDVKKVIDVSRNVFIPRPNVDSIVLQLTKKPPNNQLKNTELFFKVVKDSFKYKRKTISNNLYNYDLNKIEEVLKKHNHSLSSRAEQLSMAIFIDIANSLAEGNHINK